MILFLTNADTEILALRALAEGLPSEVPPVRAANPSARPGTADLEGASVVVVRLLGGRKGWGGGEPFDALVTDCKRRGLPLLAFGGEAAPDAEMAAASTVVPEVWSQAFAYLSQGGLANLENLLRYLSDTFLGTSAGWGPPAEVPAVGLWGSSALRPERPTVAVVFYRAHLISGNTQFVDDLCRALEERGTNALPVWCYSLRPPVGEEVVGLLGQSGVDVVLTTVLAAGAATEEGAGWDATALAGLGTPLVQAVSATSSSEEWLASGAGLRPLDVAMSVAIPEFDGRIVSVPFSFKETVDDGEDLGSPVTAYRTQPDRVARVAGLAANLARLRRVPPGEKKVALVLSAYPTRRSRLGNAVGLDTPASVLALLEAMREAGYRVDRMPANGDELMAELAAAMGPYDSPALASGQAAGVSGHGTGEAWRRHFADLPERNQKELAATWGPPPGTVWVDGGELVFPGLDLGGALVTIQPPRGFGENPAAVYHSPDLVPTHHFVAFYRWLAEEWGAHAVVHMGKHGTLEWLPGKGVGLSAECWPDIALSNLPLVYPFVVNDPGEGVQAKRRAHAVVVDHLVPPLTRAETYDDLARLETLLDTYAQVAALDPTKLPAVRAQVWDLLVEAEIHRDLGLAQAPGAGDRTFEDAAFDDLVVHLDSYLCELKDAQIRGGLHTLGQAPAGDAELDLVLALTRLPQGRVPSLRAEVAAELGIDLAAGARSDVDHVEAECRRRLVALQEAGWPGDPGDWPAGVDGAGLGGGRGPGGGGGNGVPVTLAWVCQRLVPALRRTGEELGSVLAALSGHHVPSGPSGAPSRGMAHVLPTGRNFYSLDPQAVPTPLAWSVGQGLARELVERHLAETGRYPVSVGLVVWGTAAMRTGGDDLAEALALLGVRPLWADESGRVVGIAPIPVADLGRPRVDVTLRVSGFFRDAFPQVLGLFDDAVDLVAGLDEPVSHNPLRGTGPRDPRVFGPKPGAYGSGILALLESRDWHDHQDLAEVYLAWGGWGYRRPGPGQPVAGAPEPDAMRRRFAGIEVAVKNQDNREHDIFDSDDYLQDHGGMVATVRALRGQAPLAWFGDSADPSRPRMRSLSEEAARVVRTRVINPKWIAAMQAHGYKGAFEMAATVDYLFGYDATAGVVEDWMYERVTSAYVAHPEVRKFFERSNPWALRSIAERLLEAWERGLWDASEEALDALRSAVLEAEGWEEDRS
jgi:cobaltochelatase CobN